MLYSIVEHWELKKRDPSSKESRKRVTLSYSSYKNQQVKSCKILPCWRETITPIGGNLQADSNFDTARWEKKVKIETRNHAVFNFGEGIEWILRRKDIMF